MTNLYRNPEEVAKRKAKLEEMYKRHEYLAKSDYQKGIISKVRNFSLDRPSDAINKATGIPTTNAGRKLEAMEILPELETVPCDKCGTLTKELKRILLDLGQGLEVKYHCMNCVLGK